MRGGTGWRVNGRCSLVLLAGATSTAAIAGRSVIRDRARGRRSAGSVALLLHLTMGRFRMRASFVRGFRKRIRRRKKGRGMW